MEALVETPPTMAELNNSLRVGLETRLKVLASNYKRDKEQAA